MLWPVTTVNINGKVTQAIAPIIISASRATDIPAFYAKKFMDCFRKGYLFWKNPFNNKKSVISFKKLSLIVFWSKNPAPLLTYLDEIKESGIDYYFNFTLNDYEKEGFEHNLPSLNKRIDTFIQLSEKIGKANVIWRFDPIAITDYQDIESTLNKIYNIAIKLGNHTNKLVFSFIDTSYKKVQQKIKKNNIQIIDFSSEIKKNFANKLTEKLSSFQLQITSCAECEDLSQFGIKPNKCIDNDLIIRNFSKNKQLVKFIKNLQDKNLLKDKGQRKYCGCMLSKDIGRYDTCGYTCIYCYAMHKNTPGISEDIFV